MLSEYLDTSSSLAVFSPLSVRAAASAIFSKPAIICSGACGIGGMSPLGLSGPPKSVFIRSAKIFACSLQLQSPNGFNNKDKPIQTTHMKNALGSSLASLVAFSVPSVVAAVFSGLAPLLLLSKSCSASVMCNIMSLYKLA